MILHILLYFPLMTFHGIFLFYFCFLSHGVCGSRVLSPRYFSNPSDILKRKVRDSFLHLQAAPYPNAAMHDGILSVENGYFSETEVRTFVSAKVSWTAMTCSGA